jgi:hypothetical protein
MAGETALVRALMAMVIKGWPLAKAAAKYAVDKKKLSKLFGMLFKK